MTFKTYYSHFEYVVLSFDLINTLAIFRHFPTRWWKQRWWWCPWHNNVFQSLKISFTTTPLFIHVNPSKPFVLEMNVFDFAIGIVLSQLGEYNLLHHVDSFIFKPEHLQLQMLSVISNDTTFFYQVHENLKDRFIIGIQGQLKSHYQI